MDASLSRRAALLVPVLALVASALLVTLAPTGAAQGGAPLVHTPSPAPGALEPAGPAVLRAWLWSPDPVTAVALAVDGAPVANAQVGERHPDRGAEVTASVHLDAGSRTAHVRFTDAAGRTAERTWTFTATDRTNHRHAGAGRVDTAVALSVATFPDRGGATAALLARADDFADALAGAPLGASVGGPLLLSARERLPSATAAELQRVLPHGATVHLLGGLAALGEEVARAVADLGFRPERHGGADRFATAAAIAALLPPSGGAVVASGTSFPDALAASVPAARDGLPILLTASDRLPDATAAALEDRGVATVTIVGGAAVVGAEVERRVRAISSQVRRVAGADRYATAAAVLEAFYDRPRSVSLASGLAFPDALAGAGHAAALGQPLLLTDPMLLPTASGEAIRRHRPRSFDVYGGEAAIGGHVARAAVRAAEDGPDAARVVDTTPAESETVPPVTALGVRFDRPVQPASFYVEVGGTEVRGEVEQPAADTLVYRVSPGQAPPPLDVAHPGRVAVLARGADGGAVHHEAVFTWLEPHPVFATAGPVELHLPSRHVELVGFHQATHHGAQQQVVRDTATPKLTLPSRGRGTGSRTAADVVASPDREVLAPVTGRVVRAGSYVLYCRYTDHYVVIDPAARPGWEVKMLHFTGLRVRAGDRVVAGETVLGDGPRQLPFRSQVDDYSGPRDWPHVHIEVVDPSIPTPPGRGC